jgi:hypothetical protein
LTEKSKFKLDIEYNIHYSRIASLAVPFTKEAIQGFSLPTSFTNGTISINAKRLTRTFLTAQIRQKLFIEQSQILNEQPYVYPFSVRRKPK